MQLSGQPPRPLISCTALIYIWSTSGRSSRSTLIQTKYSFITAATLSSSKLSCSITWHQWQAEYPILTNINLFSSLAFCKASAPQGYQLTGLLACCNKYGEEELASLFIMMC